MAALAISVLGIGVAGSIAMTGNAQRLAGSPSDPAATPSAQISVDATVPVPKAFVRTYATERSDRPDPSAVSTAITADQARDRVLATTSAAVSKQSKTLVEEAAQQKAAAKRAAEKKATAKKAAEGTPTLPVTSGYTIAAHFGDVGSWARYHTGFDFAAPIGTPVHAPTAGVVTNAGSGSASGWAGTYVTIRHADGTQTLYAHLSATTVSVGDTVRGGDLIGRIGVTGRSFGPHLHFEVYPAGIEPGDVYHAVDPLPWLNSLGLKP